MTRESFSPFQPYGSPWKMGGRVILASHLGRPKGKRDLRYSLAPVAERLSQLLGKRVGLAKDCIGEEVQKQIEGMKEGEVLLLENLRYHPEEEKNDEAFSKASLPSAMSMSMMPLARRIGPTLPRKE